LKRTLVEARFGFTRDCICPIPPSFSQSLPLISPDRKPLSLLIGNRWRENSLFFQGGQTRLLGALSASPSVWRWVASRSFHLVMGS
jgi:hypothetical protein